MAFKRVLQTQVTHYGADYRPKQFAFRFSRFRQNEQQLIAVGDLTFFIDHYDAVAVAIERDAYVSLNRRHGFLQQVGLSRTASVIDVATIGLVGQREHLGAELGQHGRADLVRSPIRAIEHDAQAVECQMHGEGLLEEDDIATFGVVDATCLSDLVWLCEAKIELERLTVEVPDEELVERISGRRVCEACGHVTHARTVGDARVCPDCGAELIQRSDDQAETVRNRLAVYREQTEPLLAYYARSAVGLTAVDGTGTVAEIQDRLLSTLEGVGTAS